MTARTLRLVSVSRFRTDQSREVFPMFPGVNVILGGDNAGKTRLVGIIDYLFADAGSPLSALGDMAREYTGAEMTISIDGIEHVISRFWAEDPSRGQLVLNDRRVEPAELSEFLLDAVGVPRIRYPKGRDPAQQQWPRLGWRTLLRQMYRREDSWVDLAHQQPDVEQFAVLATFLGISSSAFPAEGEQLADRMRRRLELQNRKAHFEIMLDEIGRELVSTDEIGHTVTAESIAQAIIDVDERMSSVQQFKETRLSALRRQLADKAEVIDTESVSVQLSAVRTQLQEALAAANAGRERVIQLRRYQLTLEEESARLRRAQVAGEILSPLRATHCPVCDQSVATRVENEHECYLCLQPIAPTQFASSESAVERIEFELQQLADEIREIGTLISRIDSGAIQSGRMANDLADEVSRLELQLMEFRRPAAWLVPPEISQIDQEIGRLNERARHLKRLEGTLEFRDKLTREISVLAKEIAALEAIIEHRGSEPNFQEIGDDLGAAINEYLKALGRVGRSRWGRARVTVDVTVNDVLFLVDGKRWTSALGASLRAYLFLGIHYALLKLRSRAPFTYPGLVILDFPADLSRKVGLSDDENYLLAPFIELFESDQSSHKGQLIAAGRAFRGLDSANAIVLKTRF